MRPSASVNSFALADGLLLLDSATSRLFAYNVTARHVWDLIEAGCVGDDLVSEFANAWQIPASLARGDVNSILAQWQGHGLLTVGESRAAPLVLLSENGAAQTLGSESPAQVSAWTCTIGRSAFSFVTQSGLLPPLRSIFAHLETPDAIPQVRIEARLTPSGEARLVVDGVERSRTRDAGLLMGGVWQAILDHLHPSLEWLALMHGGAVSRDGKGIALCAPSGSGKSTLTAALTASGFGYLADDLIAVAAPDGKIVPWPLPISLKPGSFDAIASHRPEIAQARRYRTKGMEARLLAPAAAAWDAEPVPLRSLVFPSFKADAPLALQEISTFQALERLLADRVWIGYPITVERVEAFVALLNTTPAYSATYGSLDDAMRLVEDAIEGVA